MSLYPSIRIEGGLLGPDVLDSLFSGDLPGQKPADFGLEARRNLTDEIAGNFADARAQWGIFQHRLDKLPADDLATSVTRDAWVIPFLGLLGFEPRFNPRAIEVDGMSLQISHRAGEAEASPPLHIVGARQELGRVPASGRPRMAPHSLLQEYLNRTELLWGIVTNGLTLRLLRNSTFVRRQSYVEFDLQALIEEQRFQDFAALFRLIHRTRFPKTAADASDCMLEKYYTHSIEQGGRVRDHLRDGVEACIQDLADGFLRHPANGELRRRVSPNCTGGDRITAYDLYRQLLRLVYRFLFLLVSEDRGLLSTLPIYRQHYSLARLRRLADQRFAFTDDSDLWQTLRVLWLVLTKDEPQPALNGQPLASALGLPVLNGDLFAPQDLDGYALANRDLLSAVWNLSWYKESKSAPSRRVNYAALDVEELGSVYESLLEFHPDIESDSAGWPAFRLALGSERKTTGSYYTPPELVGELIRSALEPVIADRLAAVETPPPNPLPEAGRGRNPASRSSPAASGSGAGERQTTRPSPPASEGEGLGVRGVAPAKEKALLSIRVCDPACGSGHFLLAAARRIGKELARVRTGADEPAPEHVRKAIRDVISHCIYGVDKNPLAVDLCRVALWLEGHTADKPLTFLDHRIRCGDSLIGVFDLLVLNEGIPDKAFEPLEGDDKKFAREMGRKNKEEKRGQRGFFDELRQPDLVDLTRHSRDVDMIADDSPEAIRRKKQLFESSHRDPEWLKQKRACDLWTAAFFQLLKPDAAIITNGTLADQLAGRQVDPRLPDREIANRQRFFHWPLEFPEVFADGGFDVVLSNPPWERVKLQEQEFFAAHDARIANAPNKAARGRLIKELPETKPDLHREFSNALRASSAGSAFLRHSGRFPLAGRGDINTYAVFAEFDRDLIQSRGRSGFIVPTGIATDDTTKDFFRDIVAKRSLKSFFGFKNERFLFPKPVEHVVTFGLMTLLGTSLQAREMEFTWLCWTVAEMNSRDRRVIITPDDIKLLNPNTGNCPIFRTQTDADITKAIYRRVPILWKEATADDPEVNPWRLSFKTLFHMANDSHHFRTAQELEAANFQSQRKRFRRRKRVLPAALRSEDAASVRSPLFDLRRRDRKAVKCWNPSATDQRAKANPAFVVQPRYWVQEKVVDATIPEYPAPVAEALATNEQSCVQTILACWAAGYYLVQGDEKSADLMIQAASVANRDTEVFDAIRQLAYRSLADDLQRDFPLTAADVRAIQLHANAPEVVARDLIKRFSPKWFIGWRDICRSTDIRTLIVSVLPRVAVGHTFPLTMCRGMSGPDTLEFVATLNSFIVDFAARQKVGGTHITYNLLKQFAIPTPSQHAEHLLPIFPRALELLFSAHDLTPLARDCGYDGPPFVWDDVRRFEIRCELDAAFFHLYLPAEVNGDWKPAERETPEQLAALKKHFPTPRDAVAYIMEQFPIVKQKDEDAHGRYRTKERILEIYDAMLTAQRTGQPYQTRLDPPPGDPRAAHPVK